MASLLVTIVWSVQAGWLGRVGGAGNGQSIRLVTVGRPCFTYRESHSKATLKEALRACLIFHGQTEGAGRFIPKPSHARGMGLEPLGRVELDDRLVKRQLSKWNIAMAIEYDWTIAYGAISPKCKDAPRGCELSTLVKKV